MSRRKSKAHGWRRTILLILFTLPAVLLGDYILYPQFARPDGPAPRVADNGVWLDHSWYFGGRSDTEAAQMARGLTRHRVSDAYFHVRYITATGALRYRLPAESRRLVRTVHASAPRLRCIAWVYAGNRLGMGAVDLSKAAVRRRMVAEAVWLVTICGFDGIQWDYEICPDGDSNLLALLRETRTALPEGKLLSVATPLWLPYPVGPHGWRSPMFAKVASTSDQVVVMAYDSGMYLPRAYAALVRAQVDHIVPAARGANPACKVMIGVPTYASGGRSHHAHAENLRMALLGIRAGAKDVKATGCPAPGVALFAEYTTQPDEWELYHRWWAAPQR